MHWTLAWVSPETFGASLMLLIAVLVLTAIAATVTVLGLAIWRGRRLRRRQRQARRAAMKARFDEDGRPVPPTCRGLCDVCGRAFERVHVLSSGPRVCPDCYRGLKDAANPGSETTPR